MFMSMPRKHAIFFFLPFSPFSFLLFPALSFLLFHPLSLSLHTRAILPFSHFSSLIFFPFTFPLHSQCLLCLKILFESDEYIYNKGEASGPLPWIFFCI